MPAMQETGNAEGKRGNRKLVLVVLLLAGLVLCIAALLFMFPAGPGQLGISVVRIEGFIVTGDTRAEGYAGSEYIGSLIRQAADDPIVDAIVLRVNSPGGTPAGAQEIIGDIGYARGKKPVVVSMGDTATSAAYYLSAYADRVYADPDTLTGGIGTSWTFVDISRWLEGENLSIEVVKSGSMKDMGSDLRPLSPTEREYAQRVVDESRERFIEDVLNERTLNRSEIEDGRVFRGERALEIGLVDELGNLNDAIAGARRLAHDTR